MTYLAERLQFRREQLRKMETAECRASQLVASVKKRTSPTDTPGTTEKPPKPTIPSMEIPKKPKESKDKKALEHPLTPGTREDAPKKAPPKDDDKKSPSDPEKGSLSHAESLDHVGEKLKAERREHRELYDQIPSIVHHLKGDKTKAMTDALKKLGYTDKGEHNFGEVKTSVMQHPVSCHQCIITFCPSEKDGETIMR